MKTILLFFIDTAVAIVLSIMFISASKTSGFSMFLAILVSILMLRFDVAKVVWMIRGISKKKKEEKTAPATTSSVEPSFEIRTVSIPAPSVTVPAVFDSDSASESAEEPKVYSGYYTCTYKEELEAEDYVVLDIETTGFKNSDKIIEIAAIKYDDDVAVDYFQTFVNPGVSIPANITKLTGITNDDVSTAPLIDDVLNALLTFIGDLPVIGHNISFDMRFICNALDAAQIEADFKTIDTLALSREAFPEFKSHKLSLLIDALDLSDAEQTHRAKDDAECTQRLFVKCKEQISKKLEDERSKLIAKIERAPEKDKGFLANELAMDYESWGNIPDAVKYYELSVASNFEGEYPYKRLAVIFRREKQFEDEIRVCNLALQQICSGSEELTNYYNHRIEVATKKLERKAKK